MADPEYLRGRIASLLRSAARRIDPPKVTIDGHLVKVTGHLDGRAVHEALARYRRERGI